MEMSEEEIKIKKAMTVIRGKLDSIEMSDDDKRAWDTILLYVKEGYMRKRIRKMLE